jgi:ppGpp synthetase/RelA/SpoT-type nucleotidyltranferase
MSPLASRVRDAFITQLDHLLRQNNIPLGVPIEARVKEWPSIEEKLSRKGLALNSITDLSDLVGIRLILLFKRDVEAVDQLIRTTVSVRSAEDTSQRLAEAQFGYQSQHYLVAVPDDWRKLPSYADLGQIPVEIQVRTLAQHIWAAASHKLQYKHEASVPIPLRRSIYRVSALLETVDLEFDRLLRERSEYVGQVLPQETADTPLNVEILDSVLTELLPSTNKSDDEAYDELLWDMNHFGITTAQSLRELLKRHMNAICAVEAAEARSHGRDKYFKHVGLARQGLREQFGDDAVNAAFEARKEAMGLKLPASPGKPRTRRGRAT